MEVRVLHVDDKDITRAGIRSLLADSVIHLVGSAYSPDEAFRLAEERYPDILLLNIQTASFDGVQFLKKYRSKFAKQKIIVLSPSCEPYYLVQAAEQGVRDYVLENVSALNLVQFIQNVYYGTGTSQNDVWNQMLATQSTRAFQELRLKLTSREEQVLSFLAQGLSNKEIGVQLKVSAETIKEHVQHIFRKIGVHDRTEAAVWAVRKGLA